MSKVQDYFQSLDKAIVAYINGNDLPYLSHCVTHGVQVPRCKTAEKCAVMKIATARKGIPRDVRLTAKKWLDENGFRSFDDGDLDA